MRFLVVFIALVGLASPGLAHRLDEYLQATTIAVEHHHVSVRMRLTPGAGVAGAVLAGMDIDGDGLISEAERHAYAGRVAGDQSLVIDGQAQALRLLSASFPQDAELRQGSGTIVLDFEAPVRDPGTTHTLVLSNRHQRAIAVDLVNTLQPRDAAIDILRQERNHDQSSYRLEFALRGMPTGRAGADIPDPPPRGAASVAATFFQHGIHHLLAGYDHLLFVIALVLGVATLRELVKVARGGDSPSTHEREDLHADAP